MTPACDGEEARAFFQQDPQRWDVVLTDLAMPRLDGRGLTLQIQQAGHKVLVVLMSDHVGSNDALVAGPQRFAAVLQKPVDSEELFRVLAEVCVAAPPNALTNPIRRQQQPVLEPCWPLPAATTEAAFATRLRQHAQART